MPRIKKQLSANEILSRLNFQWANSKDIADIAGVGLNKALIIKNEIQDALEKQGYRLPRNLVPMNKVVEYLKIDIRYLKKIAKEEI